jgi:hypothetical protein
MRIQVTQKHIDSGLRGSCSGDPVSLAMKDAGLRYPWAGPTRIVWVDNLSAQNEAETPESVIQFMKSYDNELVSEPFEFELEEV